MSRGRRISRVKFIPPSKAVAAKYLQEWDNKNLYHDPHQYPDLTRQALFNKPGLVSLDIGCGTGEFTNALAKQNPENDYIGIEISRRAIYHAVNQAARLRLENILYIRADYKLLNPLLSPSSLLNVYLIFPDPNYGGQKRRKHRIFNQEFLDEMFLSLGSTGYIQVVTDQKPFLMSMLETAEADSRFTLDHPERYLETFKPPEKTRFQIAWEKFDRPVFQFRLTKQTKSNS